MTYVHFFHKTPLVATSSTGLSSEENVKLTTRKSCRIGRITNNSFKGYKQDSNDQLHFSHFFISQ